MLQQRESPQRVSFTGGGGEHSGDRNGPCVDANALQSALEEEQNFRTLNYDNDNKDKGLVLFRE